MYKPNLKSRKLLLRAKGWVERTNRARCGNHWIHPKFNDTFSLKEAESIEVLKCTIKEFKEAYVGKI